MDLMGLWEVIFGGGDKKDQRKLKKSSETQTQSSMPASNEIQQEAVHETINPYDQEYNALYEFNKQCEKMTVLDDDKVSKNFYKSYKKLLKKYAKKPTDALKELVINTASYVPSTPQSAHAIYQAFNNEDNGVKEDYVLGTIYREIVEKGLKNPKTQSLWTQNYKILKKERKRTKLFKKHITDFDDERARQEAKNLNQLKETIETMMGSLMLSPKEFQEQRYGHLRK